MIFESAKRQMTIRFNVGDWSLRRNSASPKDITPRPRNRPLNYKSDALTIVLTWQTSILFGIIWKKINIENCDELSNLLHVFFLFYRCVHYGILPKQCYLIKDPVNPCCDIPKCNFQVNYVTHVGEVKVTTPRPLGGNLINTFFKEVIP